MGFQTNLTFPEQRRVFRLIPGLENAEFARYGVMHRNTFVDAPRLLDESLRLRSPEAERLGVPVHLAGQIAGTEGYCEAIRSGLHVAFAVAAELRGAQAPALPRETAFGALLAYATDPAVKDYQPMHVNFGILPPFEQRIRNKRDRYAAYAERGAEALAAYKAELAARGVTLHADERAAAVAAAGGTPTVPAGEADWETEYLAADLAVRVVGGVDEAIGHVNRYGTKHSEAIVAEDEAAVEAFLARVDAAAVYANASTAFTDGAEFGLGAEIGISTQKLHARGPFALDALTSYKYVLRGSGQVRA